MTYDPATHATEHFAWSEWDPRNVSTGDQRTRFHFHANGVLEPLRSHLGRAVTITPLGGVRTAQEQHERWLNALAAAGGNEAVAAETCAHPGNSRHEHGDASDLLFDEDEQPAIVAYLKTNPQVGGIGRYSWGIHVDSRPRGADGVIALWGGA